MCKDIKVLRFNKGYIHVYLHSSTQHVFHTMSAYSPRLGTNSMPVHMSNVQCSPEALTLLDCSYSRKPYHHSNDLGMRCKKSKLIVNQHLEEGFFNCSVVLCNDGDLRLVGTEKEYEGLLEVCFSQKWGTINGDGWSAFDTQVACRQLGFDAVGMLKGIATCRLDTIFFNIGEQSMHTAKGIITAPIYMANVACYGSEEKLTDCTQ